MRTMVNGDSVVECLPRLSVKDGNGSWQNITSRLYSVSVNDSIDADSASATLQLRNNPDLWVTGATNANLDPLDVNSSYYLNSEPLLGRYHELKLEISKDAGAHYYIIFQGYVGPGTVTVTTSTKRDDTISLVPCDLAFPYKALHFKDSLIYKDASATSIMTQIFVDHGFNQSVTVIDEPNRTITEVETGETNVWAAQKSLIEATGYSYRIRWSSDAFKPCVYDPDRSKDTPDAVFSGTFQYRKLGISEADARTKVIVEYRNRNTGNIEYAQDEDETARNKYGIPDGFGGKLPNTMWYSAQGTGDSYSLIDTPDEASDLAGYILYDVKEPAPDVEIRIPRVNPQIEIHDLLSFVGDDYTLNAGVVEYTWSWSTDNKFGETIIQGTADRVIGEFGLWLSKDSASRDVQQELQLALLQGDGKAPVRPETPILTSYWGVDSSTGNEVPIVVATVTPNKEWDLANYYWSWQVDGETETESRTTREPRLVIKSLPIGKTVRVWVQACDYSANLLQ